MKKEREQAFINFVNYILKECQRNGFTLNELEKIPPIVKRFYNDNAIPFQDKRD